MVIVLQAHMRGGGGGGHWTYLYNEFEHDPQMVSANYVGDLVIRIQCTGRNSLRLVIV